MPTHLHSALASNRIPFMSLEMAPGSATDATIFDIDPLLDKQVALRRLPFIRDSELIKTYGQPSITYRGVTLPLARIICSPRDMDSWAGDGSVKHLQSGQDISSFAYANQITGNRGYVGGEQPIKISVFQDNTGEMWGAVTDGSHRVMAAKMNAEESLEVDLKMPLDPATMNLYRGNIIEEFGRNS